MPWCAVCVLFELGNFCWWFVFDAHHQHHFQPQLACVSAQNFTFMWIWCAVYMYFSHHIVGGREMRRVTHTATHSHTQRERAWGKERVRKGEYEYEYENEHECARDQTKEWERIMCFLGLTRFSTIPFSCHFGRALLSIYVYIAVQYHYIHILDFLFTKLRKRAINSHHFLS